MPLPTRYEDQVPELVAIWKMEGYFKAQVSIWEAECIAASKLYGKPNIKELLLIKRALVLAPQEIKKLSIASGHETNKLLRLVQDKLPPHIGNYIHKGNTSSDVLDTSLALQIRESLDIVEKEFKDLSKCLKKLAIKHKTTLQIARTHGQHGMPHTFGRQVLGWYAEVERGIERVKRAKDVISYGKLSGEVGTNVFIAPELEEKALKILGLKPDSAPTQVISRDRHAEVLGLMAVNSATLARIATNIRLLSITDIGEIGEPFESKSQQGSSAMPHKKNPELDERIDGLNRRVRGAASEELDAAILWLERDISHSSTERFTFPDAFGCLVYSAKLLREVIDGIEIDEARMSENIGNTYGAIYSSRLLNSLLDSGAYSRTEGYEIVKELAQRAIRTKTQLLEIALVDKRITKIIDSEKLRDLFDPEFYLKNINVAYKRLGLK